MVVGRKPILQQNWLMIELTLALFKQSREYQGMLELVWRLALIIESMVWEAVGASAPWKVKAVA